MNPADEGNAEAPAAGEGVPHWQTWWERETALTLGGTAAGPGVMDPFAARRAEPRVFAFFWTMYLLGAVLGAVLWLARAPSAPPSAFSPAARTMLVVIAAGIVVLWPMTRLSQLAPVRPVVRAAALDLFVMLGPAQMVIWPLVFLADWHVAVVAAVAAQIGGWGALVGGVVAIALVQRSARGGLHGGLWRPGLGWMLSVIALVGVPTLVLIGLGTSGRPLPAWAGALSPFDYGGSLLGQGLSGPTGSPTASRWAAIAGVWGLALLLWVWARVAEATDNRTREARFV